MAYIRMKKGNLYANVFDSPEMIASAKSDGYVIATDEAPVKKAETKVEKAEEKPAEKTEVKTPSRTKRQ